MDPPPMAQPPPPPLPLPLPTEAYPVAMPTGPFLSNANPPPNFGAIATHPPYTEMITAAITALREKDGSSKKAISKFIEGAYPNLPPAHPALLTHHLKRLKNSGQLVMVKKSYMLPPPPGSGSDLPPPLPTVTAPPANFTESPTPKRRGRPPKPKPFAHEPQAELAGGVSNPSAALGNGGVVSTKKSPGRPPKPKLPPTATVDQQQQFQQPVYAAEPISSNSAALGAPGFANGSASLPKRRGRPPKDKAASFGEQVQVPGSSVKRRPGRPPKFGARPRGRPRKSVGLVAAIPAGGRSRGRPRKRPMVVGDGVTPAGMKRRGRPPGSVSGARKLSVGRTGRPVGRPRKNASTAETQASEGRAREELTRKLEYMQLKVRNAVTLLKPHLSNANIIDLLTALQDLEELATMEITAPAMTEPVTVPISEPTAPMTADMSAPPPAMPAPAVDVTAPPYATDPGLAAQLHMSYS